MASGHDDAAVGPAGSQRETAAGRHGVERVAHEVDQGLVERVGVGPHGGQIARVLAHDAHAGRLHLVGVELGRPLQQRGHADGREGQAGRPRQLQQPLHDAVDALQLARHHRLELGAELLVVEAPREVPAERQQRRERVLDLVGEAGGEAAEGGQPVGAPQPLLELAHHRDVAHGGDHAEVLAVAALERHRADLDRQRAAVAAAQGGGDAGRGAAAGDGLHQDLAELGRLREDLRAVAAGHLAGEEAGHHLGGRVQRHHAAVEVDGDDAGRQRVQDVVGVALEVGQLVQPLPQLGVGVLQRAALVAELGGHVVERHRQPPDLVVGDGIDAQVELAARDGVGALGHPLHRSRDAPGHHGRRQAAHDERGHRDHAQLPARAADQRLHALLGEADPHRAPLAVLHDDRHREVVERAPGAGGRLLHQRLARLRRPLVDLAARDLADALRARAVGDETAVGVEDERVQHVLLGGQPGHVLLQRGEVVEEQMALRDGGQVLGQHLPAPLGLVDDGRALPLLDDDEHRHHDQEDDRHRAPQQPGLQRARTEAAADHGWSQIFRSGM